MEEKISIITPAYNCEESIIETLKSIESQTYENWYHIIVDDGSTDNSYNVIADFINQSKHNSKYKLITQSNSDQLNAIIVGKEFVSGDYVFILHSDDTFGSTQTLEHCISIIEMNPNIDALISNLKIMDQKSKVTGEQIVKKYSVSDTEIANQLLNLGRNQYVDVAFYRKNIFLNQVYHNYLLWNTPFWLDLSGEPKQLNVMNIEENLINYRVFAGNYINSQIGLFNVTNGEIRTAVKLMNYYHIPFYSFQNILSRIFSKLNLSYYPLFIYKRHKSLDPYKIISRIIEIRYKDAKKDIYTSALLNFYKNSKSKRTIEILDIDPDFKVYYGKDVRLFANDMFNNNLHELYQHIFHEMNTGFSKVVCDKQNIEMLRDVFEFLNLLDVEIVEKTS